VDFVIRVAHEPDEQLGTVEHPLLAFTPRVPGQECSVGVVKVEPGNRFPYLIDLVWWKRDLQNVDESTVTKR
jgi:hypothetical protein